MSTAISMNENHEDLIRGKLEQVIIVDSTLHTIRLLFCFGRLIVNSDMHTGNLSFFEDGQTPFLWLRLMTSYLWPIARINSMFISLLWIMIYQIACGLKLCRWRYSFGRN